MPLPEDGEMTAASVQSARTENTQDPEPERRPWWRRPLEGDLWHNQEFLRLWAAQTVSVFGSQITSLALPLAAVLTLQVTAAEMGVLQATQAVPALLFGLVAGAVVDRRRRRPILVWTDIGRALALGLIPLAAMMDLLTIELLLVVGFVVGTLSLFFDVAYFSFLPSVVQRQQLVEGNSKLEVSRSASQIVGPSLGGVLVQVLTAPLAIALDALSFLASALLLRSIRAPEAAPSPQEDRPSVLAEIREGLGFVIGSPILRALVAATATFNLGLGVILSVYILYLTRTLDLSPSLIGIIFAFTGPGFLVGALLAGYVAKRLGVGPAIMVATGLGGASLLVIPLASGPSLVVVPLLAGANLLYGVMGQIAMINHLSLRQHITPDRLLGRTNATMRFISWSATPLAALLGGTAGEAVGLRPAIFLGALLTMLSVFWLALSPVRRLRELPLEDAVAET
jgi:predicted MFS family arabinose efflux permease